MKIKKLLRRATVVWCLYGLGLICIWIHPMLGWLFRQANMTNETMGTGFEAAGIWFFLVIGLALLTFAGFCIHWFSNWFFNEK